MTLTFKCEHCHKKVSAPDSVGGKRGKCPFCKESTYTPMPVSDDEILDLAPLDDEEELSRHKLESELWAQERDLIAHTGGGEPVPLGGREGPSSGDLPHLLVNSCIGIAAG
ncbi:MAG: hypothetical protein H8E53_04585, partial [Planctomycetes bacterium]|nr:hypothetical protein [Planctomycetota bacterium]